MHLTRFLSSAAPSQEPAAVTQVEADGLSGKLKGDVTLRINSRRAPEFSSTVARTHVALVQLVTVKDKSRQVE